MLGKPLTVTAPGRPAWLGWAGPLCSNCLLRLMAACKDETVNKHIHHRREGQQRQPGTPPPPHKNIEACFQFSWLTARLAAHHYCRPTLLVLIFGVFMMERVSGNLPRHFLRLCVSALEDNYSLRVDGGMPMLASGALSLLTFCPP